MSLIGVLICGSVEWMERVPPGTYCYLRHGRAGFAFETTSDQIDSDLSLKRISEVPVFVP
jgi:hypothetical protein